MSKGQQQTQVRLPVMLVLPSLLLLLTLLSSSIEPATAVKVCGSQLSELLDMVCGGRFNPIAQSKPKRGSLDLFDYVESQNDLSTDLELDPLRNPSAIGQSKFLATRRLMRGVVDECCFNACSYSKMLKYCAF